VNEISNLFITNYLNNLIGIKYNLRAPSPIFNVLIKVVFEKSSKDNYVS